MDHIYEEAKDLHVRATMIYEKEGETKAYVDDKRTIQFTTSELYEAFVKGALVFTNAGIFKPVGMIVEGEIIHVLYAVPREEAEPQANTENSSDEFPAVLVALESKADE